MRPLAFLLPLFTFTVLLTLPQSAQAQIGGGTSGGGTTGGTTGGGLTGGGGGGGADNTLDLPTLGLDQAFGAADVFEDTRRATGQSAGAEGGGGAGGGRAQGRGGLGSPQSILSQLFGGGQQVQQGRRTLRAPLRADFDVIRPANTQVASTLQTRFINIRPLKNVGGEIRVQLVERTAILTGSVETARQRDFAERITRLEPGVSEVQNQLVVLNPGE